MPEAYAELMAVRETLEQHYRDMQDIEFTVQQHKLYMLQTRNGKRTAAAVAAHGGGHGARGPDRPRPRRCGGSIRRRSTSCCTRRSTRRRRARCWPRACRPARARRRGAVVFSADEAESRALKGEAVILVRIETSPEDIHGMHAARAS